MPPIELTDLNPASLSTAPRLQRRRAGRALLALLVAAAPVAPAWSQQSPGSPRVIPEQARLGIYQGGVFPQASLNGSSIVVAPGFRLFDTGNRVVVPSSVIGQRYRVAYVTGPVGELLTAWVVTEAELATIRQRLASASR